MHGLAVYLKEVLPFARDLSQENSAYSYFCFQLALLYAVSYSFLLYRSPSLFWYAVFDSVSSTLMRFSRSTHLLTCLYLETLTSIIRTGLLTLVELIDLLIFVIIFLSRTTLLRWLTFLLGSLPVVLTVLLFWIYFFFLTLVFVLQWFSLHWKILIVLLSQFQLTFHNIHNGMACFIALLMTILALIWTVLMII